VFSLPSFFLYKKLRWCSHKNKILIINKNLRYFGYPPDMQKLATETVLEQAELIADEIVSSNS